MDDLNKNVHVEEADPAALEERTKDEPGSFLDLYRSLKWENAPIDEMFVEESVMCGVIPASLRYGTIPAIAGPTRYRGVVKSTKGDFHYFNWNEDVEFKLVPADASIMHKNSSVMDMFKTMECGCDLRKEGDEEEDETEKAGAPVLGGGVPAVEEAQWVNQQQNMMTDVHPGAAQSQTPDDPTQGRNWHQKALHTTTDAVGHVPPNEDNWSSADLIKSWGIRLQESAPSVMPPATPIEAQYMKEVLGMSETDIQKGALMAPRHRTAFERWKTTQLRGTISGLQNWLNRNK